MSESLGFVMAPSIIFTFYKTSKMKKKKDSKKSETNELDAVLRCKKCKKIKKKFTGDYNDEHDPTICRCGRPPSISKTQWDAFLNLRRLGAKPSEALAQTYISHRAYKRILENKHKDVRWAQLIEAKNSRKYEAFKSLDKGLERDPRLAFEYLKSTEPEIFQGDVKRIKDVSEIKPDKLLKKLDELAEKKRASY